MRHTLRQKLNLAKAILQALNKNPLSRTKLEHKVSDYYGSNTQFARIFTFLCHNGYVAKTKQEHCAPYMITDLGKLWLAALP
jgi:predicted transcriptional regulator